MKICKIHRRNEDGDKNFFKKIVHGLCTSLNNSLSILLKTIMSAWGKGITQIR